MGKVERGGGASGWAEYDQLDGVTLEEGEKVSVLFPDSSLEYMTVTTKSFRQREMDMGTWTTIPVIQAYVEIDYKGLPIQVRLVNKALRVERR